MLKTQITPIQIAIDKTQPALAKGQKTFNTLNKKIEARRSSLADWQEIIPRYQQKHALEMLPLIKVTQSLHAEMVYCLDRAGDKDGLTKSERSKTSAVIADLTAGLLGQLGHDEGLKNLYNKHSDYDYDAEEAAAAMDLKSMMESMMGVDLGDDIDMSSPEALLKYAQAHMQEQHAVRMAQEQDQAMRKKSAKQLAKEQQQKTEEQEVSQSLREIYRKLVSVLHPDREPDEQERVRKTALMQRVNEAYDKKNLLLLLALQLELEHIDQNSINNISESKLKHFVKILKEQLSELENEILYTESMFRAQFCIHPFDQVTPNTLMRNLDSDIAEMVQSIRKQENDLRAFEDIKNLKAWLKTVLPF